MRQKKTTELTKEVNMEHLSTDEIRNQLFAEVVARNSAKSEKVEIDYDKYIAKFGTEESVYTPEELSDKDLLHDEDEWDDFEDAFDDDDSEDAAVDSKIARTEQVPLLAETQEKGEFALDNAEPLDRTTFPNQPHDPKSKIPTTVANVVFLLKMYGVLIRYNVIKKGLDILIPGFVGTIDNVDNVILTWIKNLARLNNMATQPIDEIILAIADQAPYNPVADWITSRTWDGVDRLEDLYRTLKEVTGYPEKLKKILLHRWLLSAIAAAFMVRGFKARGVLTLQGPQSIGKTSWIAALVTDAILQAEVIKLDHHMDAGDKDAKIGALAHWIVEIGELDGSFKKDIARLKGFITSDSDKIRIPYAKSPSNFPRRTIFCATVNDANFLVDQTGNSRWWTIAVESINYRHNIDMQQLWAQIKAEYDQETQWWLTREEEAALETYNYDNHRSISTIEEILIPALDLDRIGEAGLAALTASEVLCRVGIKHARNAQARECGALLRKFIGAPKKIQGAQKWRVPFVRNINSDF